MSADDEKPPLDAALRHLAEQQRRSLTSHPTPQELAAYRAGELPPEAEARILDHLSVCRECSDLLLDLSGFADLKPPQGIPELTDEQVEQDWQALRTRMGQEEGKKERTAEVVPIRPARPAPKPERSYWLPIAASLLAVLGFSFGLYQSVQVARLSQPRLVHLVDPELAVRGDGFDQSFSSHEAGVLHLIPDPEAGGGHTSYSVEISREGELVASIPVETIADEDPFVLISPGSLEPGKYQAYLYGFKGGEKEQLSEIQFEVDVL